MKIEKRTEIIKVLTANISFPFFAEIFVKKARVSNSNIVLMKISVLTLKNRTIASVLRIIFREYILTYCLYFVKRKKIARINPLY